MGFAEPAVKAQFDAAVSLAEGEWQTEIAVAFTQTEADAAHEKYHRGGCCGCGGGCRAERLAECGQNQRQ
jgi:hypothetical protein